MKPWSRTTYFTIQSVLIFDHHRTEIVLLPLLILAAAVWCFRRVEVRRSLLRIPVRTVAVLVIALVAIELLMDGSRRGMECDNGLRACLLSRPQACSGGANCGCRGPGRIHVCRCLLLWRAAGAGLAGGEWKAIEQQNIRWTSNTTSRCTLTGAILRHRNAKAQAQCG